MVNQSTSTKPLAAFGNLLRGAWEIYKKYWKVLIPILAVPYLLSWVPVIGGLLFFIVFLFAAPALFVVLRDRQENVSLGTAFERAKKYVIPSLWVSIIYIAAIWGGAIALVIPGIILGGYLCFSMTIVVAEDARGMQALLKSWTYVKGYWWAVILRMIGQSIIIGLVVGIVGSIIGAMFADSSRGQNAVADIIGIIISPFSAAFSYLLFESLREAKGGRSIPVSTEGKNWIIGFAVFGIIAIPLSLLFGLAAFLSASGIGSSDFPNLYK